MNAIKEAKGLKDVPWHMFGFGIFAFPMGMDALFFDDDNPKLRQFGCSENSYIDMFGLIARVGMTLVVDHSGRMHIQRKPTIKDVVVNKEAYCISIRVKQGLGDFCRPKALGISDGGAEPSCLFGSYM